MQAFEIIVFRGLGLGDCRFQSSGLSGEVGGQGLEFSCYCGRLSGK